MKLPKRVLAIVNPGAEAQPAFERAVQLAAATGAELRVQAIVYDPRYATGVFLWDEDERSAGRERRVEEVRSWIEKLSTGLDLPKVTKGANWGHPFDQTAVAVVEGYEPDWVFCQPRDPSDEQLSLSEWRFLRRCPAPVWLARAAKWPDKPQVLAAVDPSPADDKPASLDRRIIDTAATVLRAFDGELYLLNALGEIPSAIGIAQSPEKYEQELRASRSQRIDKLLPEGIAPVIDLPASEPLQALKDVCARRGIDLVVMGMLARSAAADLLIGSTAREFIPRSGCDVLLVKPR